MPPLPAPIESALTVAVPLVSPPKICPLPVLKLAFPESPPTEATVAVKAPVLKPFKMLPAPVVVNSTVPPVPPPPPKKLNAFRVREPDPKFVGNRSPPLETKRISPAVPVPKLNAFIVRLPPAPFTSTLPFVVLTRKRPPAKLSPAKPPAFKLTVPPALGSVIAPLVVLRLIVPPAPRVALADKFKAGSRVTEEVPPFTVIVPPSPVPAAPLALRAEPAVPIVMALRGLKVICPPLPLFPAAAPPFAEIAPRLKVPPVIFTVPPSPSPPEADTLIKPAVVFTSPALEFITKDPPP